MTTKTETGYWTVHDDRGPVTHCAACALEATNDAMRMCGIAPAASMSEAATVVEMNLILNNDPEASTLFTYSETGRCSKCGKETLNPNTETGDISMSSTTEAPVTFWTPADDDATLCEACGVKEINGNALPVILGMMDPFESMTDIVEAFKDVLPGGEDYFAVSETGKCQNCGVEGVEPDAINTESENDVA